MKTKRYGSFDGLRKRCRHARKEWNLCACPWFYAVTHQGVRHRGKIPKATTEADARTAYQLLAARVRAGLPAFEPEVAIDSTTVEALGTEWLSLPRGRKASVIDGYRDHLRAHINPVIGTTPVSAVTPEICERLVTQVTRQRGTAPLSIRTKKSIAITLQAMFNYAVKKRLRADNPAAGLPETLRDPDAKPDDHVIDPKDHAKYFTADEAQILLATCRATMPEWYDFVLTGLQTGMRLGELLALRYEQINWREGYILVNRAFVKRRYTTPKNSRARTVSMSRVLRAHLYVRWRQHLRTAGLVFPSSAGTPWGNTTLERFWPKLLSAAELGYRTRHAMRHTHDSLMLQAGVPPARVAAESGRSVQETMRTYAHFLPGGNRADADVLAAKLGHEPKATRGFPRVISGNDRPRSATSGTKLRAVS
jgi:integrase